MYSWDQFEEPFCHSLSQYDSNWNVYTRVLISILLNFQFVAGHMCI
jgi:hypothetical protein